MTVSDLLKDPSAQTIQSVLPQGVTLMACNLAAASASSYWLLKQQEKNNVTWATLRIAPHLTWLLHAVQITIFWQKDTGLTRLAELLNHEFSGNFRNKFFKLSK
ncbi:hypothetical protein [Liquorilactobacillus satsumensis]|uniref:hypothetical protein n=1 Tax=Liquorilactobacillus satsumensis TaxID=259059 RepID=UPI000704C0C4|nr:hypothetical protein [Liquorilactobacillus satsumensis]MCC7666567.1 hypothetical protein [Liquorilactobacillus satsumensis]MCP9312033.1 hypothetical protein [Liquorilactobacillus satsumensis]MCP9357466.1 hypothetical protein [Liquorilactobacillus satsumensis]MCP9359167.1 hypothetical protein [Liquorilactobacillus satsumensis]MCP9371294.1 hypothetical protein [Liquorilactobacillus satsumensis]